MPLPTLLGGAKPEDVVDGGRCFPEDARDPCDVEVTSVPEPCDGGGDDSNGFWPVALVAAWAKVAIEILRKDWKKDPVENVFGGELGDLGDSCCCDEEGGGNGRGDVLIPSFSGLR